MTVAPDVSIGDRYTLLDRIATGGMGEVWRARDTLLDRNVAVKILKAEYAEDPAFLARFRTEAKHTAALSHPGIATVFDYGEVAGTAFLVMELVPGEPLSTVLAREGALPPDRTLDIVGQAALALQCAHEAGVIHRDVKPGNLMIRPDGVVKVTDFGIARAVDASPVTATGMVLGTAAYLSPEQATGTAVTAASDIYSLGVVAYECLAGARPFTGDSAVAIANAHATQPPPPLPDAVPPLVDSLVMQALDKQPERRQSSAGELGRTALALAAQLRIDPGTATKPAAPKTSVLPTADTPSPTEQRRIRNIFIAVGAAVVLLGFLLLYSCSGSSPDKAKRTHPSSAPRTVHVDPQAYLGRPFPEVRDALSAKHLDVRSVTGAATAPAGTVTGLEPTGSVREGSTVTVTVAAAPPHKAPPPGHAKPPKPPKKPKKHGH